MARLEKSQRNKTKLKRSSRTLFSPSTLILLGAIAIFLILCFNLDFTQDDAYISFRYAENFLQGEGLVYNHNERVEGYTNFLWIIILALVKKILGIEFLHTARALGVLAGSLIFYFAYRILKDRVENLPPLLWLTVVVLLLSNLSLPYWSIASLETSAFACLVTASIWSELQNRRLTPALLVIATLLRPEGALVFLICFTHRIIQKRTIPIRFLFLYAIPLIPFAVFKFVYYGSLVPNPYYAKSGVGLEYILSGFEYLWYFARTIGVFGIIFLIPILMIRRLWLHYSLLYLFAVIYIAYIVWVGGDVLKVYRFFVPVVPALYLLFTISLREITQIRTNEGTHAAWPALGLAIIFATTSLLLMRGHVVYYQFVEKGFVSKMSSVASVLKQHLPYEFSVATATIGVVGYELIGHKVIDMLGLTDRLIARNPEELPGITSSWKERRFNSRYLLRQQPDIILFSTGYRPSAPAERALMMHSEFRRCYGTIGFFVDTTFYAGGWKKRSSIDIDRDVVHPDLKFVDEFSEGVFYSNRLAWQKALDHFRESARLLGEEYAPLLFQTANCYYRLNQIDESRWNFERAIIVDPQCWEARLNLIRILSKEGDTTGANLHKKYLLRQTPWLAPMLRE